MGGSRSPVAAADVRRLIVDGAAGPDGGFGVYPRDRWVAMGRQAGGATDAGLARAVAAGEPIDPVEVQEVYLPLARWIDTRLVARTGGPTEARAAGAADTTTTVPVVGITGSVAVGKTTVARLLAGLLRGGPARPTVDLLATDGFLYPNRVLEQRGLLGRKGFPETYDRPALAAALDAVRSGRADVPVPVYSHSSYDIVPGEVRWLRRPDLLVVEGLTLLQGAPGAGPTEGGRADRLVDLAVYVDADERDLAHWHADRLLALRSLGAPEPSDFLRWLTSLSDAQARQVAESSWSEINLVNLRDHVAPTRRRADIILEKGADHRVRRVLVRDGVEPADAA